MKDYYKILNIKSDASQNDIKRAYFMIVRKYPPERFPDEFMEIREAYEVLSNEDTRKQYDSIGSMPDVVKMYYNAGKKALAEDEPDKAIKLLEKVIKAYPDLSIVESLLGEAYFANENYGKAIRIFEKLVNKEKVNARYVGKLADAYLERGWHKKAAAQYQKALALDKDNIGFWQGLIECYEKSGELKKRKKVILNAIEYAKLRNWDNPIFYFEQLKIDLEDRDYDSFAEHLQDLTTVVKNNQEHKENAIWFLSIITELFDVSKHYREAAEVMNVICELSPEDEKHRAKKDELNKKSAVDSELRELSEDKEFHRIFYIMFMRQRDNCSDEDCFNCDYRQLAFEMKIFNNIDKLREQIIKLKNMYPVLYETKSEFFEDVINPVKSKSLSFRFKKRLDMFKRKLFDDFDYDNYYDLDSFAEDYSHYDDYYNDDNDDDYDDEYDDNNKKYGYEYDDDEYDDDGIFDDYNDDDGDDKPDFFFQEPYKREEPKVGRNDPCPCGSGKKYKKCCGRSI